MTSIMTTEAEVIQKLGAGVSASSTDAMMTAKGLQAESFVNVMCLFNLSDELALNADVKGLLSDIVSSLVAIEGISYDMSGYTTRTEAEDMINVLRDGVLRNIGLLRDVNSRKFIVDA